MVGELGQRHIADFPIAAKPQADRTMFFFPSSDDDDHWHLLLLHQSDAGAERLVAAFDLGPQAMSRERVSHLLRVGAELCANGHDGRVDWTQPQGEGACRVLDVYGKETLDRAVDDAVDYHWSVTFTVLIDVRTIEPLWQLVI